MRQLAPSNPAPILTGGHATAIALRTEREIEEMARAGAVAARVLRAGVLACRAGATTRDVDAAVGAALRDLGAEGLFRGYQQGSSPPFAADACVSVNDEVVHAVPSMRTIRPGDVVTIDVGVRSPAGDGWCADVATTVLVPTSGGPGAPAAGGKAPLAEVERLLGATREALALAVDMIGPGVAWSEVAAGVQRLADHAGLGVVTEYTGHGIGRRLHEPPVAPASQVCEDGQWADFVLQPGMALAVEPIFTLAPGGLRKSGRTGVRLLRDGWTVVTKDGSIACHEEHTIVVTENGRRVLTAPVA